MKTKKVIILFAAIFLSLSAFSQEIINNNNAVQLVKKSLSLIGKNYADTPNFMNAYYKEMVKQNDICITTNEALLNIKKASYLTSKRDIVSIAKIKGNCNSSEKDNFIVKLQGGPLSALEVDVIKRPFLGSYAHEIDKSYNFDFTEPTVIDNKECYVVLFDQKPSEERILYKGKLYIDKSSLAIAKIEYSKNVEKSYTSFNNFIMKKPKKYNVKMISANYIVTYKMYNNKWHLNYSTSDINFNMINRVDNTYNTYNIKSEIALTKLITENITIDKEDQLTSKDILTDKVKENTNDSEWEIYNKIMLIAANE